MGKVLVIGNADFSNVAVKKVDFLKVAYIKVIPTLEGADSLISGEGFYAIGETATLSATSNSLYSFVKWSDGVTTPTRTITVTTEGNVVLYAEYALVFQNNSFIWGNGGILIEAGKSSGSLNETASTITKFIHTLSECTFIINPEYQEEFTISVIVFGTEKPTYNKSWTNVAEYTNLSNLNKQSYTLPAGIYLQIGIKNRLSTPFTSDLTACAEILQYNGNLELVS